MKHDRHARCRVQGSFARGMLGFTCCFELACTKVSLPSTPDLNSCILISTSIFTLKMMDVDDDFAEKSGAFANWLQSSGATLSDKIELADLRQHNAGRGVGTAFLSLCQWACEHELIRKFSRKARYRNRSRTVQYTPRPLTQREELRYLDATF